MIGRTLSRNAFDPNDDTDVEVDDDFFVEPMHGTDPARQSSTDDEQEGEAVDGDPIDEAMKTRGIPRIIARRGRIIATN